MNCKFLQHGLAVSYDHVAKPCCVWTLDNDWKSANQIQITDLTGWHHSVIMQQIKNQLATGAWPTRCGKCQQDESQGITSMRQNGDQSQAQFAEDDISLEIRPGSVCNFACQTCWPEASSRVADFQQRAGLIPIRPLDSRAMHDFGWLDPIKHRVKETILLGGEPFYDKNCLKFLAWAADNLTGSLMMFTNGSRIDYDWIQRYRGRLVLIFSLDGVGSVAEYVRFGTDWPTVLENFLRCRELAGVELRVNVTVSVYNYLYLEPLMDLLCEWWPSVVNFGYPTNQPWMRQSSVPVQHRETMIRSLRSVLAKVRNAKIPLDQHQHAVANISSTIQTLETQDYSPSNNERLKDFILAMDRVKKISLKDHCPELHEILF